ncbi:TorF family putative porin [Hyphomicrobium sulfonivorans]|uniref:TorF family putative porin n=1 Tax=Hyphomicrobium sulfonivorans TaxID=121290 RepID=UPI00156F5506|nr:TorF family putative porin [Hyphomicrobium sulfonivorans]MBI1649744.1 hypothetical protein [Hyphomicrobium sulfonivorans]NSL71659.1 hypothetical protein [Hyphomicrobium sulfonivorans]
MTKISKLAGACGAAGLALVALSGSAFADGYEGYQVAAPAASPAREFTYSFNLAATSDYIFRGFSQSSRDPVLQGGADIGYGIFYAGYWVSGVDFDNGVRPYTTGGNANAEMNLYGGFKPTWNGAEFDFGVIYYFYPGASDRGAELDMVEFKAGVSGNLIPNLATGLTIFWSPEYTGETGSVWTFQGNAGYEFRKIGIFTPTINGTLGYQIGDNTNYRAAFGNGRDNYLYWNAGLDLAVENINFDFRYWDTNVSNSAAFCDGPVFQCGSAFVFSIKVTVP